MGEILDTYASTAPFGFGALYRYSAMGERPETITEFAQLYLPQTNEQIITSATWQLPMVASFFYPGYTAILPVLAQAAAPAVVPLAGGAIAVGAVAFIESNKDQIQLHYSRGAEIPEFRGY